MSCFTRLLLLFRSEKINVSRTVTVSSRCLFLLFYILTFIIKTTSGLNIVITGTSQGIGLDAARRLVADGHQVYHACRSTERAMTAWKESGGGTPMTCDLADLSSVRRFASNIIDAEPNLDVLCLNAAIAPSTKSPKPEITAEGFEECIGVNHLGHFLLANLLKDHLKKDGGILVVTASSVHDPEAPGGRTGGDDIGATLGDLSGLGVILEGADGGENGSFPTMVDGSIGYLGGKVYKDSKLCNVLFSREANRRWGGNGSEGEEGGDGISVRSFNPGFIPTTGLFRSARKDNPFRARAFTFIAGLVGLAVPVEVGGARLAFVATAGREEIPDGSYLSSPTGESSTNVDKEGLVPATVSIEASNESLASKLWDRSGEIVGLW